MGDGVAIRLKEGKIYAPCDGRVKVLFEQTNHAIGIGTDDDMEILIHCGLDTIYLKDKVFNCKVKRGTKVKTGQLLITFDQEKIKIMFQIGIPSAFQNFMLNFSLVVLIAVANLLGVYASAAVGIAAKINVIFILPVIALHAALSAIVGQNVGAGKLKRVEKTAIVELIISSLYSLFICIIMWCFSKELLSIFTNDAQTLLVGANYFKGHCWDYVIVMPLAYCLSGIFIGSGHTSYVAVGNTVGALASRIPLAYFLSNILGWGTLGIGIAYPISTAVTNIVYIYCLIKGKWKTAVTTKEDMNLSE